MTSGLGSSFTAVAISLLRAPVTTTRLPLIIARYAIRATGIDSIEMRMKQPRRFDAGPLPKLRPVGPGQTAVTVTPVRFNSEAIASDRRQHIRLGRKIDRHQRPGQKRRDGGEVHDPPGFSLDHAGEKQSRQVRQRHDVELEHPEDLIDIFLIESAVATKSRVVDQDVDRDAPPIDFLEQILCRLRFGQIHHDDFRAARRTAALLPRPVD